MIDFDVSCHSCFHPFTAHNKMVAAQHNTARIFKHDLQVVDLLDDRIAMAEHDNFGIDYPTRLRIAGSHSVSDGEITRLFFLYVSINIFDVSNCICREALLFWWIRWLYSFLSGFPFLCFLGFSLGFFLYFLIFLISSFLSLSLLPRSLNYPPRRSFSAL